MMRSSRTVLASLVSACLCAAPASAQAPCTGDLDADRVVDGNDLGILLGSWGACVGCVADINADGFVDGADLGFLLNGWGACPVVTPSWAMLVEAFPDPAVVIDPVLRQRIAATGWAWRVRHTATQIEMLLVPPGTFQMGCSPPTGYDCYPWELPVHQVALTAAFYLGRYEVTQAQWVALIGSNPSHFRDASSQVPASEVAMRPVERVSWTSAHGFLSTAGLRFPTEAEWEFACRAATATAYGNGSNADATAVGIAWIGANSDAQTHPVGLKPANRLGFHDMHGNVWEWVGDWYSSTYYASSPASNPQGPSSGATRVVRGGSFNDVSYIVRSSFRTTIAADTDSSRGIGFRAARTP